MRAQPRPIPDVLRALHHSTLVTRILELADALIAERRFGPSESARHLDRLATLLERQGFAATEADRVREHARKTVPRSQ